ncbi:MAG: ribonuclease E/G, partial [Micrococcus sp.]|nr:ribonuclease E/G [Micrococcus sp.]
ETPEVAEVAEEAPVEAPVGRRTRGRRRRAESPQGAGAASTPPRAEVQAAPERSGEAPAEEAVPARADDPAPESEATGTASAEAVSAEASAPRRRRSRRATSDGRGAPRTDRQESAPAAATPAEPETVEPTPGPAAPEASEAAETAAAPALPARRRSRRAVSSDGAQVSVQSAGEAQGSRFTAQAAAPAERPQEAGPAPVMLGVGVKAEDIVRGE